MASVKYDIEQKLTNKNQATARVNIGFLPDCLSYVHELAVYADEVYRSKQPIETNTLRLSFENLDYDPAADGKSPGGIWTKIKSNIANIWDWHREDPNWYRENSFGYNGNDIHILVTAPNPPKMNMPSVTEITVNPEVAITEKFKIISSNTTNVENMKAMFQAALGLTEIWKPFDFSNCTDVSYMFNYCINLKKIPTDAKWNMPKVTTAKCMFLSCTSLETDLPYLNLPINTTLYKAFMHCYNIKKSNGFNSPLCTDIRDLFEGDLQLKEITTFGDSSKIQTWHDCFGGCVSLEKIPETLDCSSAVDCEGIFSYCASLKNVPTMIFGNDVTTLRNFFACCSNIEDVPDNPVFHYVKNFAKFLSGNDTFWSYHVTLPEQLVDMKLKKLPDWKPENITNADYMFYGLKHVSKESVEEWFNFLKNSPTLVSHVGTFRECAHNENIPDDWK